jgi:signal transduction histidine kinase
MSTARIVTDLYGRILQAPAEVGDLLAIEERWLAGKPLAAFVAPEQVREFRTLMVELGHRGGPRGTTLQLVRRDGNRVEVEVEVLADVPGERLEWLLAAGESSDGEARRSRAPALSGLPLRRLLARFPIGVVSLDRELTVEYVNPAGRAFLDGTRVGARLPEPLPSFSLNAFAGRLFGGAPPVRQVAETRNGRLLELDGIPGNRSEVALLLVQDITSRERRERAEHEFAANAAHELRTPIAAITSALDVLQAGANDVPDDRDLFLGHIERETARLARLVDALMLLARIQTGQEQPALRLVDAAPLLVDVAARLEPREGVEILVDCGPEVSMLTDDDLLSQAVWNLAANAIRHTESGEIRLSGRDLGRVAEIEVRDTGCGISDGDSRHVLNRFERGQHRVGSGFGLGLPISQEIARALGGTLTLDSELGVGTRVRIHVPSARLVA